MRILCITTSRADWNGLGMVADALAAAGHNVRVCLGGDWRDMEAPHLNVEFTVLPFRKDGDSRRDRLVAAIMMADNLSHSFTHDPVDLAVINGDRYEALACAYACSLMDVPIAHISGGDVTEGSADDAYRNAITALAELHFATNFPAFRRLLNIVGHEAVVINSGDPGIDRICATPVMTRDEWLAHFGLPDNQINPLIVVHPETRGDNAVPVPWLAMMFRSIAKVEPGKLLRAIIVGPNADPGAEWVRGHLKGHRIATGDLYFENLPPDQFYACMTYCDFMIGNSSAGVHEAPVFGLPVVNIGDRQKGRILARNVIQVDPTEDDIWWGIQCALAHRRIKIESPYGDGHACERIVKAIEAWQEAKQGRSSQGTT